VGGQGQVGKIKTIKKVKGQQLKRFDCAPMLVNPVAGTG